MSSPNRSRAASTSPRSRSPRISTARRESSETGPVTARRPVAAVGSATAGADAGSGWVRESPFIEELRSDRRCVYSLLYRCRLLTLPNGQEYDRRILPILLGLHVLGDADEHRG